MTGPAPPLADPQRSLKAPARWRGLEVAFWLAAPLPFLLFPSHLQLATQIAITALFALSLDLILGYAGIVSLGHAAFFGLGAYAAGLVSRAGWGEPLSGLLVAAATAGLVGWATSLVIARARHLALIMITLGLGLLLHEAANSAHWLTGGVDGLQGVRTWPLFGRFPFDLYGYTAYAYSLAVLFLVLLQRSAEVLVILILGGAGQLYGGPVGAIVFMVARDQFSGVNPQYWYFWMGALLVLVVMFLPNGILGGLARLRSARRRESS